MDPGLDCTILFWDWVYSSYKYQPKPLLGRHGVKTKGFRSQNYLFTLIYPLKVFWEACFPYSPKISTKPLKQNLKHSPKVPNSKTKPIHLESLNLELGITSYRCFSAYGKLILNSLRNPNFMAPLMASYWVELLVYMF